METTLRTQPLRTKGMPVADGAAEAPSGARPASQDGRLLAGRQLPVGRTDLPSMTIRCCASR